MLISIITSYIGWFLFSTYLSSLLDTKRNVIGITILSLKFYCQTIVAKYHDDNKKSRHVGQRSRIENWKFMPVQ